MPPMEERTPTAGPLCPFCRHPQTDGPKREVPTAKDSVKLFEWVCPSCGRSHIAQDPRDLPRRPPAV